MRVSALSSHWCHWFFFQNITCLECRKLLSLLDYYDLRKSGDKWPKFKEIGIQKIKLAKVVAKEKKILARTLKTVCFPFHTFQWQWNKRTSDNKSSRMFLFDKVATVLLESFKCISLHLTLHSMTEQDKWNSGEGKSKFHICMSIYQKCCFESSLRISHLWAKLSHIMRKPVFAIWEQQRCRSACAAPLLFAA